MSVSTTTYTTVNGRILRQNKDGVVHNFVSDPQGSVVMVRDTSGNTVYKAEYDPYGNVQSETGTNPSSLGYVGTLGYIKDSATSMYVRARYLLNNLGRWLTKDPLWPSEAGYVYAGSAPNMSVDPSGAKPLSSVCPPPSMPSDKPSCTPAWNEFVYAYCNCNRGDSFSRQMCNYYASAYYADCRLRGWRNKPKPRGDWFEFAPPPGQVGEVTPRPAPHPFPKPVISGAPIPVISPVPEPICIEPLDPRFTNCGNRATAAAQKYRASDPNWEKSDWPRVFLSECNKCCDETGLGQAYKDNCEYWYRQFRNHGWTSISQDLAEGIIGLVK